MSSWAKGFAFMAFTVALALGVLAVALEGYDTSDCGLATDTLCQKAADRHVLLTLAAGLGLWLTALWLLFRDRGEK